MKTPAALLAFISAGLVLTGTVFGKSGWVEDYEKGLATAKAEKKMSAHRLHGFGLVQLVHQARQGVFSKPKFKEYARRSSCWSRSISRQMKRLSKPKQQARCACREILSRRFPTLSCSIRRETDRQTRYVEGGPEAFIAELEK
jgi:hypothetical protein